MTRQSSNPAGPAAVTAAREQHAQPANPRAISVPEPAGVVRPNVSLGVIVAIACVSQFMVVVDGTIVLVALPSIHDGLHFSASAVQWVVDGYLLTLGGLLILGARSADLFGRRRVFQVGLVVFSLAGGLAQDPAMLLVARAVQGVGAAALAPSSLSLITATHTEAAARRRAIAIWSTASGIAAAAGLVLGGVLTTVLTWRWIFFINVPVGAVLVVATATALLPSPAPSAGRRLDIPGALAVTLGASALVYGISVSTQDGWGSPHVIGALAASVILFGAFVTVEARSTQPLVPLEIFSRGSLSMANVAAGLLGATMTGTIYFMSLYFQQALGYSAVKTGLGVVPMAGMMVVGARGSTNLIPRVGPKRLIEVGGILAAVGLAWMSRLTNEPAYLTHILVPSLVAAAGMSIVLMPTTVAATRGIEPREAGLASGLINTSRQIGSALGLAVFATIAVSVTAHSHSRSALTNLVHGYQVAFLGLAGISLLITVAATTIGRRKTHENRTCT